MDRLRYAQKMEHWGYAHGVMAYYPEGKGWLCDLYGPFLNREECDAAIDWLIVHAATYESFVVVKIETPEAPPNRDPRDDKEG